MCFGGPYVFWVNTFPYKKKITKTKPKQLQTPSPNPKTKNHTYSKTF